MEDRPFRRTVLVFAGYAVAVPVVLGFGGWLSGLLALPPLFHTLLRGGLLLGLPVALMVAWAYPSIGVHGDDA